MPGRKNLYYRHVLLKSRLAVARAEFDFAFSRAENSRKRDDWKERPDIAVLNKKRLGKAFSNYADAVIQLAAFHKRRSIELGALQLPHTGIREEQRKRRTG